jgi:hypothetical protein
LSDGSGSCAITETVAADYTFTATYKGDVDDVSSSTAAGTDVTVGQDDTSTVITNTTSSFVVGQPITIDVSVSANSPGSGTPTGTVTVSDGGTQTCPATLSGGVGSCQVTETTAGAYTFSAAYGGDSNYVSSSTENGMAVTVGGDATTTDITTTTPSEPVVGQPITRKRYARRHRDRQRRCTDLHYRCSGRRRRQLPDHSRRGGTWRLQLHRHL